MSDTELSEWMAEMVKKAEENIELNDTDDTSEQARKLLESWSLQTENFAPKPKKKAKETKTTTRQKTAIYRKLDTPMMVAKKIETNRPSVDPTLIMDARRQHVKEMQAQRLERQAAKQMLKPKRVVVNTVAPKIPKYDVEKDIKSYKQKMAENMAKKKKELEERKRQSMQIRAIEESAQQTIAKENKTNKKRERKYEKETNEINMENLRLNLQLYMTKRTKRIQRIFYSKWVSRCSFKSKTYQRAAAYYNFQIASHSFTYWKRIFHQRVRERELDELENRLVKSKQNAQAVEALCVKNLINKAFVKWSSRFKASIEMKIIEEQHRKRRALLINKIVDKEDAKEKEIEKEKKKKSSPKKLEQIKPKIKVKPIKVDPRIEAMERRAEEQKKRKLEKAARDVQQAEVMEREKIKADLEAKRKKKLEHQKFLEEEKRKRDEQKRREEEFERALQRKKYITTASKAFRLRRLQLNAFIQWSHIMDIKDQFEVDSEEHYAHTLMNKAIICFMHNKKEKEDKRAEKAKRFYQSNITHLTFLAWFNVYLDTKDKEDEARRVSGKYLMKNVLEKIIIEKRRRQKIKYALAAKHHESYMLKSCMRVWPIGCAAIREDERKERERDDLMQKALKIFGELSDDDFI